LKQIAVIAAKSALVGAGKKAGEFFFENYLAPKLRAHNLLPKGFHKVEKSESTKD
jgi:hypothetical protein